MTSYACRSVVGCSTDEDVVIIGVCGNGQAASFDLRVVHLAVVVAVSRLFSHRFLRVQLCVSGLFAQEAGMPMTKYLPTEAEIEECGGSWYTAHKTTAHINHDHAKWVMWSVSEFACSP